MIAAGALMLCAAAWDPPVLRSVVMNVAAMLSEAAYLNLLLILYRQWAVSFHPWRDKGRDLRKVRIATGCRRAMLVTPRLRASAIGLNAARHRLRKNR